MNKRTLRVLEYYKIIEQLTSFATCPEGKRLCEKLKPSSELTEIIQSQRETEDALTRLYQNGGISFSGVYPIKEAMKRTSIGAVLSIGELLDVAKLLKTTKLVKKYGEKEGDTADEINKQDSLTKYFEDLIPLENIEKEIHRCILSEDEIADDASAMLKDIRKEMKAVNNKVHTALNGIIANQDNQDLLQENIVTMKNGRYCIPVKAEYKGHFPGLVHDQSSSGSTYFIEPMSVVNLNNTLKELSVKETMEIEKILAGLSERVADNAESICYNADLLVKLDFIFAKAKYAKAYNGTKPEMNQEGEVDIKQGRHPLLDKDKVVPIDIRLGSDFTMLIITGPNTGGKTVSLKTMGLFTLMGQSGLHIPAFQGSKLSVFKDVFADIGDEQSIEQSLSTFSSHMTNIVYILKHATRETLVLFDELGGGTDPVEGSALAISILAALHRNDIRCMATTHYSELKTFAMMTDGIENASCEFDVETLCPTYHLQIGIPGKSNAFAIAEKLGISKTVIDDAKMRIDNDTMDMETILADLENSKKIIKKEQEEITANKEEIKKLKDRLSSKNEHIEQRKQDILRNAREEAKEILEEAKAYADESIRKYNNWDKKPQSATGSEMEKTRSELRERICAVDGKLQDKKKNHKSKSKAEDFHLGDTVYVISMNSEGIVRSLPNAKGMLTIQMGILQSTMPITDVEIIKEDKKEKAFNKQQEKSYGGALNKSRTIKPEINLLGMTVDEAIMELDKYLDDACLSHLNQVRVVHGKGTGALRKGIHDYLKKQKYVKNYRLGEFGEGDAGVTIVEL